VRVDEPGDVADTRADHAEKLVGLRSIRGDASALLRSLSHTVAGETLKASALTRAASCGGVASPTAVDQGLSSPVDFAASSRRSSKVRAQRTSGVDVSTGVHSPSNLHSVFPEMGLVGTKGFLPPSAPQRTVSSRRKPERRCDSAEGGDTGERWPPTSGDAAAAGSVSQVRVKA